MRTLLVLLGIVALVLVAAMALGYINIDQTRPGVVQAPKFEANVGRVDLGMENKTITVPTLSVDKPADGQTPAAQ